MNDIDFLSYFSVLSSSDSQIPDLKKASEDILKSLLASNHNSDAILILTPLSEKKINEDIDYTIKKIIGLLTSETTKTQFNFTPTLTLILTKFEEIDVEKYLSFIGKECSIKNAVKKSENKHFHLGKVLAIHSLILTNRIDKHERNMEIFNNIIDILEETLKEEPSLEEIVVKSLEALICKNSSVAKQKTKTIISRFKSQFKQNNVNFIYLFLVIYRNHPNEFPFKSQLENLILNYSNLLPILNKTSDFFPRESLLFKEVIDFLWKYSQDKEDSILFWQGFWDFFVKELVIGQDIETTKLHSDYKKFFILLSLLRNLLKNKDFSTLSLEFIINKELLALWFRNLNVLNVNLKNLALKIQNRLVKIFKKIEKNEENREVLIRFIKAMKEKSLYKFSPKSPLAEIFFEEILITKEEIQGYSKFLLKKAKASSNIKEKIFFISEIMQLIERKVNNFPEESLLEASYFVYMQTNSKKISLMLTQNQEELDDLNEQDNTKDIKKYKKLIFENFFSIVNSLCKRNSSNFSGKKNAIWKGLSENNDVLIFRLVEKIFEKEEKVEKKKKENEGNLKEYVLNIKSIHDKLKNELENIEDKNFLKKKIAIFNLITSVAVLSLQSPQEGEEALLELIQVYEEFTSKNNKKIKTNDGKSKKNVSYMNVLVDIMISLLTKSSSKFYIFFFFYF